MSLSKLFAIAPFCVLGLIAVTAAASDEQCVTNWGIAGANSAQVLKHLPEALAKKPDHVVLFVGMNDAMNSSKLISVKDYQKNLLAMHSAAVEAGARSVSFVTVHPVVTTYLQERHPKHPQLASLQQHLATYCAAIHQVAKENMDVSIIEWRARFISASTKEKSDSEDSELSGTEEGRGEAGGTRGDDSDGVRLSVRNHSESLLRCEANCQVRDGVHLTSKGYQILADEVYKTIGPLWQPGDTVACIGDSLTYGSKMTGAGTATGDTYPAHLLALIKQNTEQQAK